MSGMSTEARIACQNPVAGVIDHWKPLGMDGRLNLNFLKEQFMLLST